MTTYTDRAREKSGLNSHQCLVDWLASDIGDIEDLEAFEQTKAFIGRLKSALVLDSALSEPAYLAELETAIDSIEALRGRQAKLSLLNETLRRLFVAVTMTQENYQAQVDSLRTGEALAVRRRSRTALPTMDAFLLLKADPRSPQPCERAAIVVLAALKIQASIVDRDVPIMGTTLVPGMECDEMVYAHPGVSILVLCCGVPYVVEFGEAAGLEAQDLEFLFKTIQQDATAFTQLPGSWTGEVPAFVTAASRAKCYLIRRSLESDPQNARNLAAIDGCLFAVCLDTESTSAADTETISRGLFGNYRNRWYGMTSFVFDACAQAGIIISYTRGIEAIPSLSFAQAVYESSLGSALPVSTRVPKPIRSERIEFVRTELGELPQQVYAELEDIFHSRQAFFDLPVGLEFFQDMGASPNSALQYLIMLAANEVAGSNSFPAVSHAVSTADGAGLKGGLDWILVSTAGAQALLELAHNPNSASRFFELFCETANQHSFQVKATRHGYSPSSFVRKPEGPLDQLVYEFFADLGRNHETAYRGYLFRATRWPNTMDILTSTLRLPDAVPYCGRPGSTCEVAAMFGLHIVMKAEKTHLFFIPNPHTKHLMKDFYHAIERWIDRLRAASELTREVQLLCA